MPKIAEDNSFTYHKTRHGLQITPHNEEWSGYYRLGRGCGHWEMVLTGIAFGSPPGILNISIRTYEDLERMEPANV